jgi:hypothetical protein
MDGVCDGGVLSSTAKQELFKVRFPKSNYSLGCRVAHHNFGGHDREFVSEDGATLGFRAVAYRIRNSGETIVILNNVSIDMYLTGALAISMLESMLA